MPQFDEFPPQKAIFSSLFIPANSKYRFNLAT